MSDEKTITYTKEDLDAMTPEARNNVFLTATKVEGKAIVRRADGSIKYDDESLRGTYGETE